MAKFVKFKIANDNATLAAGGDYSRDVLVNVDDIENVGDVVAAGNYSVVVTLKGIVGLAPAGYIAGDLASTIGGRILTLQVSKSPIGTATPANADEPVAITVPANMPSQSIIKALTANPGGVAASCQLGKDGAGLPSSNQMYWSSAVFSSDSTL
jgi:hypothetical protein